MTTLACESCSGWGRLAETVEDNRPTLGYGQVTADDSTNALTVASELIYDGGTRTVESPSDFCG